MIALRRKSRVRTRKRPRNLGVCVLESTSNILAATRWVLAATHVEYWLLHVEYQETCLDIVPCCSVLLYWCAVMVSELKAACVWCQNWSSSFRWAQKCHYMQDSVLLGCSKLASRWRRAWNERYNGGWISIVIFKKNAKENVCNGVLPPDPFIRQFDMTRSPKL